MATINTLQSDKGATPMHSGRKNHKATAKMHSER